MLSETVAESSAWGLASRGYVHVNAAVNTLQQKYGAGVDLLPEPAGHMLCIHGAESGSRGQLLSATLHSTSSATLFSVHLETTNVAFHVHNDGSSAEGYAPSEVSTLLEEGQLFVRVGVDGVELQGLVMVNVKVEEKIQQKKKEQPRPKDDKAARKNAKEMKVWLTLAAQGGAAVCLLLACAALWVRVEAEPGSLGFTKTGDPILQSLAPHSTALYVISAAVAVDAALMATARVSLLEGVLRSCLAFALCFLGYKLDAKKAFTPAYLSIVAGFVLWAGNPRA